MGVRRSGKSVLARLVLAGRDFAYVNFDDERLAWLSAGDLQEVEKAAAAVYPTARVWLLDEVQNVPGWELFVNRLQRSGLNLVVTGSNSKLLSRELATHLTGRYVSLEVFPFSFREFLEARGVTVLPEDSATRERGTVEELFREYSLRGGFPEVVLSGPSGEYLRELHDKVVSRDVVSRFRVKYPRTLKEISLYCFSNPGTALTYNRIQRAFGLRSVHTAESYVHFLEEAYLLLLARPFSFRFTETVKQPRKIYTIDNGLTGALSIKVTEDRGAMLENLVYQEFRRRGTDVFTWSRSDHAVDFLVREDRKVVQLVQVCAALSTPDTIEREYRSLHKASAETRCRNLLLLTPDGEAPPARLVPKGPAVRVLPIWKWALS